MKFNTRDKKPHIWAVAVLAVIAAGAIAALAADGADKHALAISVILDIFFLAVIVLLIRAFFTQIGYNPYSYNIIYYAGFSLFLLSVLLTHIELTMHLLREPEQYLGLHFVRVMGMLANSAKVYMLVSCPFILALSAALCVSNISLIRHEGKRFVNILGIILSFLMLGGELLLFAAQRGLSGSMPYEYVRAHDMLINIFAAVYLYFECMTIGIMIANAIVSRYCPEPDVDFLIILGCAVRKDGTPSPLLQSRIDRALAFRKEQLEKTGKELVFITSGGKGSDEILSESETMKRYLMANGIAESSILTEDRSTSTFENMKFSKAKIGERFSEAKIAFSTSDYHVFRSGLFARRVKMRAVGMGAKSKWYFWPNALVREFVGILVEHRGKQALILAGLIAVYAALSLY